MPIAKTDGRRGLHTVGEALFGLLLALALATAAFGSPQDQSLALSKVFPAIGIREGLTVCEIGAGAGDLTFAAARLVGSTGRVLANELGDNVVKLRDRVTTAGLSQITVVAGGVTQTNFPPGACDAVFMNDVYHHFSNPTAMNVSIVASLKPGSRLGIIDFTPPGAEAPQPSERGNDGMHGITAETLGRELQAAGLDLVSSEVIHRVVVVIAARPRLVGVIPFHGGRQTSGYVSREQRACVRRLAGPALDLRDDSTAHRQVVYFSASVLRWFGFERLCQCRGAGKA